MPANTSRFAEVDSRPETRVGFLVLDNFGIQSLTAALEPLRTVNRISAEQRYSWRVVSETGDPVRTADGLNLKPDDSIHSCRKMDVIIVISGENVLPAMTQRLANWLSKQVERGAVLGGIDGGASLLGKAGLQNTLACHPATGDRVYVTREHQTKQPPAPVDAKCAGGSRQKLAEVMELMENNLEEPIDPDHLSSLVGISRRQMERLFHDYLGSSPSKYYLQLRLTRARELLRRSSLSIADISATCGFVSTAHFSRCYRNYLGTAPRDERGSLPTGTSPGTLSLRPAFTLP